ncbi:MAG: hypothetical protein VXA43_00125, partial [Candidatus Poseidoniales archaeon]
MGSLWQFFGLPDPEGSANAPPRPAPPSNDAPVTLSAGAEADSATPAAPEPPATTPTTPSPLSEAAIDLSRLRTPPLGWTGPLTPDGEAFHDLGIEVQRQRPLPNKALRYIAPDVMKRIPTGPMLEREIGPVAYRGRTNYIRKKEAASLNAAAEGKEDIVQQRFIPRNT